MACCHLPSVICRNCAPEINSRPWLEDHLPKDGSIPKIKRGSCIEDTDGNLYIFDGEKWLIGKELN